MDVYRTLLTNLIDHPAAVEEHNGKIRRTLFGTQMRFDLADGFPLIGPDEIDFAKIVHITLWQLSGNTNVRYLKQHGIDDYDEFIDPDTARYMGITLIEGQIGPVEQKQWRRWSKPVEWYEVRNMPVVREASEWVFNLGVLFGERLGEGIDQIAQAVNALIADPIHNSPLISAWNVYDLERMVRIPPVPFFQLHSQPLTRFEMLELTLDHPFDDSLDIECSASLQQWCERLNLPTRKLTCQLYQQDANALDDIPLVIANYGLLVSMIAHVVNMAPGEIVWTGGKVTLDDEEVAVAEGYVERTPTEAVNVLRINAEVKDLAAFKETDILLSTYHVTRS